MSGVRRREFLAGVGLAGAVGVAGCASLLGGGDGPEGWSRVSSIYDEFEDNHYHGIGYDHVNELLYLGTHYGVFVLTGDRELFVVGDDRSDTMGLAVHPEDPSVLYRSGHPREGGNLGVERSTDGGLSWEQIFEGLRGDVVDFHSMTISRADPDVLAGTFGPTLYVSEDGGFEWEIRSGRHLPPAGPSWGDPHLAADSGDRAVLYASAFTDLRDQMGLFVSEDLGTSWELVTEGVFSGVTAPPGGAGGLFAYTGEDGIVRSEDGGRSWEVTYDAGEFGDEFVFGFAFDPGDPEVVYAGTTGRVERVLVSADGGYGWEELL